MDELLRRYGPTLTGAFVLLTAFWLLMLVILPNVTLFEASFRPYLPVVDVGGPKDFYSLGNYLKFFSNSTDTSILGMNVPLPIHLKIFFGTIYYSTMVTVITFVMAYPLAFYLAKVVTPKSLPTLFLLLFVPMWVSEVLRAFAWWLILAYKGPLNAILQGLGILDDPVRWIAGYRAIIIGLVYTYVLFMVFPIYNAIQSLDTNQIEAAQDLGSPWWRTHAGGGVTAGARALGVSDKPVVHPDHPAMDAGGAGLEYRGRLCLPVPDPLHLLCVADHVAVQSATH
jgi:spermidine/putrescine transport system permease protein